MNDQPARKTFFGGCPHDCPDTCAMIYEVENGKLVEVRGNKEHPMTRGGLCVKLKDFHDHHHNPDRLMFPLRRTGPKGSKQFERISWDEAISEIGRRWREIIATYGSQAIMPYSYLGNMGLVQGINSGDPFFNRLGTTVNEKTFCTSNAECSGEPCTFSSGACICSARFEQRNHHIRRHDVAEFQIESDQRLVVPLIAIGGIRVRHHDGAEIAHHRVARGRLAADIGDGAGHDHRVDATASQHRLQIG